MSLSTRADVTAVLFLLTLATVVLSAAADQLPQDTKAAVSETVLIPEGEFLMGSEREGDHNPPHTVRMSSFYMDKYEVTNAQYLEFCKDTDRKMPEFWGMEEFRSGPDFPDHPVIGVSWSDVKAYAEWCGKRLPTEAEWEYAARGGLESMNFPNGNTLDSTMANCSRSGTGGPVPVGSYPANGYGLYDMAGNVCEWVADYYSGEYYSKSSVENPQGPESGKFRVMRGGGWHSGPSCNRVYYRNALPGNWVDFNVGFRCVKDAD
jgi:formylglycine-generating enzyme required for sulfatase activity